LKLQERKKELSGLVVFDSWCYDTYNMRSTHFFEVGSGREVEYEKHYNKGQRLHNLSVSTVRTRLALCTVGMHRNYKTSL